MLKIIIPLCCFFVLTGTSINAQVDSAKVSRISPDHIETDRPDESEAVSTVPRGYFQMEHGFSIEDTEPGFIYSHPSSLWRFGVNDRFELRLITEYIRIQREPNPDLSGFLPLSFGIKSRLTNQRGGWPAISFLGHLKFPGLVAEEFETTYFAPDFRLAFEHDISNAFTLSYNVGAEWDGESAEPNFTYSLSPNVSITDRLGIFAELYGSTPQREDDDPELRVDAGFTFLINNDLMLDISAGQGLTDNAPERFVAFGFSYRFKL